MKCKKTDQFSSPWLPSRRNLVVRWNVVAFIEHAEHGGRTLSHFAVWMRIAGRLRTGFHSIKFQNKNRYSVVSGFMMILYAHYQRTQSTNTPVVFAQFSASLRNFNRISLEASKGNSMRFCEWCRNPPSMYIVHCIERGLLLHFISATGTTLKLILPPILSSDGEQAEIGDRHGRRRPWAANMLSISTVNIVWCFGLNAWFRLKYSDAAHLTHDLAFAAENTEKQSNSSTTRRNVRSFQFRFWTFWFNFR